ncbi:MAG: glycosyltransferase family 4 protein [Bacilli bacterium]|nr:glycosyltransferase family 4 protein [Bacilli bacterium]
MKILLTSDTYENQINGVSCSVITLRDELRKKGHDVRVLTLSSNRESKMVKTDYLIGSFSVPFYPDARQTLKFHDKIIKDIVAWHPDIIHIQTEFSIGKISKKIAKLCNCPYINTSHTLYEDYSGYVIPSKTIGKAVARKFIKRSYRNSDAIIAPTQKIKDLLLKYEIKKPIYIIPTGIDLDRFYKKLSMTEKSKLKSKLNLTNKSKVLVSIGRVAKEKNLDEIIEFLPELIEKDNNIVLLIGGDGPYKKNLEQKVKKLKLEDHVRFLGMIPPQNTYKYYQLGDIFVCASTSETQGITYIEALACGIPLVCRYDKCLDGVIENGYNGYTYNSKEEYRNYIFKILGDKSLHSKLKKNALESSTNYSKEKFRDSIENLYNEIINKKGSESNETK